MPLNLSTDLTSTQMRIRNAVEVMVLQDEVITIHPIMKKI